MYKRVVVTGSLAYDHIMSMPTSFADHIMPDKLHIINVSFIMKEFTREFGGTAGNISYNLRLHKIPNLIIATAGKDIGRYKKHLDQLDDYIDTSGIKIYKNDMSANGFVITDQDNNQIWGFYEGAMRRSRNYSVKSKLRSTDFLIIAPNDPIAMIRHAKTAMASKVDYMFDPAFNIPHMPTVDLMQACENSKILIGNDYEIALILERLGWSLSELIKRSNIVVTTLGEKGSVIAKDKKLINIKSVRSKLAIKDPTGAGDAYRAGFTAGFVKGKSLKTCGQMGSTTAFYTVEEYGTQTHSFTRSEFKWKYKRFFKTNIEL